MRWVRVFLPWMVFLAGAGWAAGCASTGTAVREEARDAAVCSSDLECSPGDQCIRPRGDLRGICGRVVDERGAPTTGIRRRADPCENDFDCPVTFRCELTAPTVGLCVKQ